MNHKAAFLFLLAAVPAGTAAAQSAGDLFRAGQDAHKAKAHRKAEALLRKALVALKDARGADDLEVGFCHSWLGHSQGAVGKHAEALKNYVEGRRIILARSPADTNEVYWAHTNVARMRFELGDYAGALADHGRAAAAAAAALGDDPDRFAPRLISSKTAIAGCYSREGRFDKAEPLYKEAISLAEERLGRGHAATNEAVYQLGFFYFHHLGQYQDAVPLFDRCISSLKEQRAFKNATLGNALASRGHLLMYTDKNEEAERALREGVGYLDGINGEGSPAHNFALWAWAHCLVRLGKTEEAEAVALRMVANCTRGLGEKNVLTADSMVTLARVYVLKRKFEEARVLLGKAAAYFEKGTTYTECKL